MLFYKIIFNSIQKKASRYWKLLIKWGIRRRIGINQKKTIFLTNMRVIKLILIEKNLINTHRTGQNPLNWMENDFSEFSTGWTIYNFIFDKCIQLIYLLTFEFGTHWLVFRTRCDFQKKKKAQMWIVSTNFRTFIST